MPEIRTLLILIPALPLAAAVLTALLGKHVLRAWSHWPTVAAVAGSCAASLALVFAVQQAAEEPPADGQPAQIGFERTYPLWTWAAIDAAETGRDFRIDVTLRADPLTAIMLATVTFVSLLVAVYSIGYMRGDPGYWRFFSYIPLFVFSMTMLVAASNFVLLYMFWEAVGLCSYLLIGFWFQKPEAAAAGKKAFLVNRIGDFGFALGVFLLWTTYGTLNFHDTEGLPGILGQARLADREAGCQPAGRASLQLAQDELKTRPTDEQAGWQPAPRFVGGGVATAICLLLLLGACGKSAQFPLHVWLPDAMEGPTPVSALIHAATMVTAGVYMVARCMPLFLASTDAQQVVAVVGGVTAIMAAVIALTQTDLKRILAYSTISQLGYMFLGLGAATLLGATAGMFHLFTHAFFKALLFLGAGSVMHAMGGIIDLRQFGGLRRRMPVTHWTFLVGCLALSGVFPLAGFWSKDLVLAALDERAAAGDATTLYYVLYVAAMAGAFLTAAYTFRAYLLAFWGEERIPSEAGHHAHESPRSMTGPLVILAVCSLAVGAHFERTHGFAGFLERTPSLEYVAEHAGHAAEEGGSHMSIALVSQIVALAGIALAAALYLGSRRRVESLTEVMDSLGLYRLSHEKFFVDQLYHAFVVLPARGFARLCAWFDRVVVDGLVDGCGYLPRLMGAFLRPVQNGLIQFYALAMVLGLLVLLGALLM
jgi:NADH-quinone oxidoreductase subunit L